MVIVSSIFESDEPSLEDGRDSPYSLMSISRARESLRYLYAMQVEHERALGDGGYLGGDDGASECESPYSYDPNSEPQECVTT